MNRPDVDTSAIELRQAARRLAAEPCPYEAMGDVALLLGAVGRLRVELAVERAKAEAALGALRERRPL